MLHLNARFFAVNAGLLTAALSIACGVAPAGPSEFSDAAASSAQAPTAGNMATTQGLRPAPASCFARGRFMLEIASVDKLSVLVNSNYVAGSKQCPTLTWELSSKHDFAPSIDKLGRDVVTVYSRAKVRVDDRPAATTVTAYGPNGMTASIEIVLP